MIARWVTATGMTFMLAAAVQAQTYGLAPRGEAKRPDPPELAVEQRLGEQVPLGLAFRDEHDRPVTLNDYVGNDRPTILVLAYFRCPMLCTEVLNGLLYALREPRFQRRIGEDYNVVVVSFDPKDAPATAYKKQISYATAHGRPNSAENWHFLTGAQSEIERLCESVGFRYEYDKERKEYFHDSAIMVLTPEGTLSRYFFGTVFSAADLDKAVVESSGGKVGSLVERTFIHMCFYYDEKSGSYKLAMNVLGIAAGVTVLVIGLMLFGVIRKARRDATEAVAQEQ